MKFSYSLFALIAALGCCANAGAVQVASGNHHTYAMNKQGVVLSFGENSECSVNRPTANLREGNLGRPSDAYLLNPDLGDFACNRAQFNPLPSPVLGLEGIVVKKLVSGQNDGAVIADDGSLYMWGRNDRGQTGQGNELTTAKAAKVNLPGPVADVTIGGAHTMVVLEDGRVFSWGFWANGILGLGEEVVNARENILIPTQVELPNGLKAVKVAADSSRSSAILAQDGQVYMTGTNTQGQIGQGSKDIRRYYEPVLVKGLEGVNIVDIFVGSSNMLALSDDGRLFGWGDARKAHFAIVNENGQLDTNDLLKPTVLDHITSKLDGKIVDLDGGSRHVVAVTDKGTTYAWGFHTYTSGNLGIGPIIDDDNAVGPLHTTPVVIDALKGKKIVDVTVLTNNSFAVTEEGDIYGWGQTANGRLAMGVKSCDRTVSQSGRYSYVCLTPQKLNLSTSVDDLKLANTSDYLGLSFKPDVYDVDEGDTVTVKYEIASPAALDLVLPIKIIEGTATNADVILGDENIVLPARAQSGEFSLQINPDKASETAESLALTVDAQHVILFEEDPTKLRDEQHTAEINIAFNEADGGPADLSLPYMDNNGNAKKLNLRLIGRAGCRFAGGKIDAADRLRHDDSVVGMLKLDIRNCRWGWSGLVINTSGLDFNGVRGKQAHGAECMIETPFRKWGNNIVLTARQHLFDLDGRFDNKITRHIDIIDNQFTGKDSNSCRIFRRYNALVNRVIDTVKARGNVPRWWIVMDLWRNGHIKRYDDIRTVFKILWRYRL